ncbi:MULTISPECIES: putative zinc-binding metallopeptidase [Myroides]|uniref:Substrate import-associated zinc metallohydrolase lipoprotein n=1 Tax=Myroides albus TaxID=2562892 RepID=A0A6I3LJ96_9FLAO|nr:MULTISPECIES: putative zinc-binding metallopeptidase [Myroides]MTG98648.1 hypothetical protein [Myroides albus]MVX37066.1 hypothetical protein [Myroides sp. LoEW2-1]UVD79211.1 putative zinc-binding metallopeptidase [Myroides albus]
MKTNNILKGLGLFFTLGLVLTSCSSDDKIGDSIYNTEEQPKTELDQWIFKSYTEPYNIDATYLWNESMGKPDKTLFPPKLSSVKPALQVVKKIWIDSYSEVGGEDFVKLIAPRQLHLIGSYNLNHNGTIVLGEAGGGARITLYNVDFVDYTDLEDVREFVHTIQHEYIHILNQSKPYDIVTWKALGEKLGGYTSNWYNQNDEDSNNLGFVTPYARLNSDEDFAETASFVLLSSKAELESFLSKVKSADGKAIIEQKIAIVEKYFLDQFSMDFFELRDAAERNTNDVINGNFEENQP